MNVTGARLVALGELGELRPAQPAAQSRLRNTGLVPLTRGTAAHQQEREALRRHEAAMTAARESLRHAERRFDESSGAIDEHIQRALAAEARRGIHCALQATGSSAAPPSFSPRRAAAGTPDGSARSSFALVPLRARAR